MKEVYENFLEYYGKLADLRETKALLSWDERVYMPKEAVEGRSRTKATLSRLIQSELTSEEMKGFIDQLNKESAQAELDEEQKANVREATREFEKAYKVPDDLIEEISKTSSMSRSAWVESKEKEDFQEFLPWLEKTIGLQKEKAEHIGYEDEPYDALLDIYEPGMKTRQIEKIFSKLKDGLIPIVDKLKDVEGYSLEISKDKDFGPEKQEDLSQEIVKDLGYDFQKGRLDTAEHPFTIGMEKDTRITNRYNRENIHSIFSAIHETGHAIYKQNIPDDFARKPIGKEVSTGFTEGQARLWENQIGRSKEFIDYTYPKIQDRFSQFDKIPLNKFHKSINQVSSTPIRVNADEVTYNLHILLRFEIEIGLFRGEILPEEIPQVWENKMEEYLGITPDSPAEGPLQDVHWSTGAFGYFPTYSLGNLYAAQIFDTMQDEVSNIHKNIEKGEFPSITEFLTRKIYRHGRKYRPNELVKMVTGEKLNEKYFINYLKDRYYPVYGLN